MDALRYTYQPGTNQLKRVDDDVASPATSRYADDVRPATSPAGTPQYTYDAIGNPTQSIPDGTKNAFNFCMKHFLPSLSRYTVCLLLYPCFGQQIVNPFARVTSEVSTPSSYKSKDELPTDLPQAKILFIRYSPTEVPADRPDTMPRRQYNLRKNHNEVYAASNKQLAKAAARYPFSYRITTQDSSTYYAQRGYKYALFHSSFNAMTDGTYAGAQSNGYYSISTDVKLFVQDLATGNRYPVDTFSETHVYYYKDIIGKFLKKVDKQFNVKS